MLQTRDLYLLTFSCFPVEEIHKPFWNTCAELQPLVDFQSQTFGTTGSPDLPFHHDKWQWLTPDEDRPKANRKGSPAPSIVRLALGFFLSVCLLLQSSCTDQGSLDSAESLGSRIHFSISQLFSAGPTTTPRVRANVLAEWHLPPGAADTEALRTSIQLLWITNHSVLSHPSLHLIFLTVRIHYEGNRVSRNKPLPKISKPSSNKVLRKQAQGESGQQEEGNQNWISALTPGPAAVIPN